MSALVYNPPPYALVVWFTVAAKPVFGVLFAVASVELDYRAPARLDDQLDVFARVARVGGASIDFDQRVECDGAEVCRARVCVACIDAETFRPRVLPADLKEVFAGDD